MVSPFKKNSRSIHAALAYGTITQTVPIHLDGVGSHNVFGWNGSVKRICPSMNWN